MPRYLPGHCQGESCGFGFQLVACRPLPLKAGDSVSATPAGTLRRGDTVTVTDGSLRVTGPGIVVLARDTVLATDDGYPRTDTLRLTVRDTLYVLEYRELGAWTWWFRGRLTEGIEFWNGPGQVFFGRGRDNLAGRIVAVPLVETWYRLRGAGTDGWWLREPDAMARPDWGEACPNPPPPTDRP